MEKQQCYLFHLDDYRFLRVYLSVRVLTMKAYSSDPKKDICIEFNIRIYLGISYKVTKVLINIVIRFKMAAIKQNV